MTLQEPEMKRLDLEIENYFTGLKNTIDSLSRMEIKNFIDVLMDAYQNNKNIYVFGNGGSAATASHMACDLNKGASYQKEQRFKVYSLNDNISILMAYSNDVSYEDVFIEQLKNFLCEDDVAVGISGSGNSPNVIKAIQYANQHKCITVGITGYDGGNLKKISTYSVNANIHNMFIAEDIHLILNHLTLHLLKSCLIPDVQYQKSLSSKKSSSWGCSSLSP